MECVICLDECGHDGWQCKQCAVICQHACMARWSARSARCPHCRHVDTGATKDSAVTALLLLAQRVAEQSPARTRVYDLG